MDDYNIIIKPLVTEQGMHFANTKNAYSFEVNKKANKIQIRKAVEQIYKVHVTSVNTINVKGKPKRVRHKLGKTASWKKAVVTLRSGETIEMATT